MFLQRLDNLLVFLDFCSKRASKNFVKNNEILINQKKIDNHKILVNIQTDEIFVNGSKINNFNHLYLVMNKPLGYVCSRVSDKSKVIYSLLNDFINEPLYNKIHSVGRLDKDTEGLLFLTTDGTFSNFLTQEEHFIPKKYYVELEKKLSNQEKELYTQKCKEGFLVIAEKKQNSFFCKKSVLEWVSDNSCYITVYEGKFHQVRRMFCTLGNFVIYLKRVSIGEFVLDKNFELGSVRKLTKNELLLFEKKY